MYDFVIRGARIADGTGNPTYHAVVGVLDGKIVRIGHHLDTEGAQVIDGTGKVLCPGFIDAHSHQDTYLENNVDCKSSVAQGITTYVGGMCGSSPAPISAKEAEERIAKGGKPERVNARRSWADYVQYLNGRTYGANAVNLVGHGRLRAAADCFVNRSLTAEERGQMESCLDECMRAGAHGLSFGLIYPPSSYADTDELVGLAKVVARHGGVVTVHMRDEGDRLIEATDEMMRVTRATGVRMVISHHKAINGPMNWNKTAATIAMMEKAVEDGYDVFCDVYPYTASSTGLKACIPGEHFTLGMDKLTEMLGTREGREALRDEVCNHPRTFEGFKHVMIGNSPSHPEYNTRILSEIAEEKGVEPYELYCDILHDDHMDTRAIYHAASEDDVKRVLQWYRSMIGSDGTYSAQAKGNHPRCFGTFPRVLGRYVRELGVITLENAIRKMTYLPAMVYNLSTKGLIREGMDADLVLFDPETVRDGATFADPLALNEGFDMVMVGGKIALKNNVPTEVFNGHIILHPDDAE